MRFRTRISEPKNKKIILHPIIKSSRYDQLLFGGDHTLSNIVAIVLGLGLNLALDMFHHTVKELAGEVESELKPFVWYTQSTEHLE